MQVFRSAQFKKGYNKLPNVIQKRTDQKLLLLLKNPARPSLRVKKIKKIKGLFECSITKNYYKLHRVGTHNILDKM